MTQVFLDLVEDLLDPFGPGRVVGERVDGESMAK